MRALVAGGAGFIGSTLCRHLLDRGDAVVCVDNLVTGRRENVTGLLGHPAFELLERDICERVVVDGSVDAVLHLASPASPADFARLPLEIMHAGSTGTRNLLDLARARGARFLLASTSEVYGDPLQHPQPESYWGNVNPVGPRAVYDEAKRFSEALTATYHRVHGVDIRIVRIFNTYGPGLRPDDGRVMSNFLTQARSGRPLTVYGDGSQTRSFCYVDDAVRGILAVLDSDHRGPVNVGNPEETTVRDLAQAVVDMTGGASDIVHQPLPEDDPVRRCPDITLARSLGWEPKISLPEGLAITLRELAKCQGERGRPEP